MRLSGALLSIGILAATATPALAEWVWVEDGKRADTYTHEVREKEERENRDYYDQEPRPYYRESADTVYVTDRDRFRDGRCDVTRTYLSDGSSIDERDCSRIRWFPPHLFIRDSIDRFRDRVHGY